MALSLTFLTGVLGRWPFRRALPSPVPSRGATPYWVAECWASPLAAGEPRLLLRACFAREARAVEVAALYAEWHRLVMPRGGPGEVVLTTKVRPARQDEQGHAPTWVIRT